MSNESSEKKVRSQLETDGLSLPNSRQGGIVSTNTIFQMLFYTLLMVTFPIASYFISQKYLWQKFLGFTVDDSVAPAAFTAVVVVHIVLGLFIYSAYSEDIVGKRKQE